MSLKDLEKINKDPIKYANQLDIDSLSKLLRKFSDKYYNTGNPIVSDKIFDQMKDVLEERDPKNSFLQEVGAPIKGTKEKVNLPFPMSSLNKIKLGEQKKIDLWNKRYQGPFILSDKLDGASCQLYKDPTGKLFLYSRGDYIIGQNISHLIDSIFKDNDISKMPKSCSVRGELIIKKKDFESLESEKKNIRNAVSGLVNAKKSIDKDILSVTKFIGYAVLNPMMKISEQLEKLNEWGFDTVYYKKVNEIDEDILKDFLTKRRTKSDFDIDGVVCMDDSKMYKSESGYPDYAFAFKMLFEDLVVTTEIVRVEWNLTKNEYLKPRIEIKPVILAGNATTTFVTGYNARYIVENEIGPGAVIKIVRSNEVIPKIVEVLKPAKKIILPDVPYKWTVNDQGEQVDLVLDGYNVNASRKVNIEVTINFFKKMGVKFMSEGIINKLADEGYDSIEDILLADDEELMEINGLGEKIVKKIRSEINRAFSEIELATFMAASNLFGRGLAERKIKAILEIYPNLMLEDWNKKIMKSKILEVEGFQDKLANLFVENYPKFINFFDKINEIYDLSRFLEEIDISSTEESEDESTSKIANKKIVFTGFRDKELEKSIEKAKGKVSTSVSSKTDIVVIADNGEEGSKVQKARELGKMVIKKSDFIKKYME